MFVPERFLRTVPMAALHDGSRFLVERYAIVTTPGLTLTDPRPLEVARGRALAGGLTVSVQGFPALPAVAQELGEMHTLYGATVLEDQGFTAARLAEELKANPYRVLHIATHGKIDADVRKSFLLTYDGRLTMDDLDRLIGLRKHSRAPVEMLTLSACETALGDDRAALGLAGIAVKAGARSAVATLWSISDEATAVLMPEFFRQLQTKAASRAQALQRAQQKTLADPRFSASRILGAVPAHRRVVIAARSVEFRCCRRREGNFHEVLAEVDVALEDLADLADDALAHAGAIELRGHVRQHEIAHAGGLRELRKLAVPHGERGEGLATAPCR